MNFFENLKQIENSKNEYYNELVNNINKYPKKVLYGIGESCSNAIKFFNTNNINIDGIFDDNVLQNNTYYDNILVTLPNYEDKSIAIIITCSFFNSIRNKLIKYDKDIDKRLFVFDGYFLEDIDINYYKKKKEKILYCYNKLETLESKELYEKLLEYRYIRNTNIISSLVEPNRGYFDKVFIDNFKPGIIIDAGAYIGNFMVNLSKKLDISTSLFYLFEPNKRLNNTIKENLKDYDNYKIFNNALCNTNGCTEFCIMSTSTSHLLDNKYSAYKISSNDIEIVELIRLDDIVTDEKVSLIKADIEGSEQEFLKGAKKTITKNKPIMLLSAYHKKDDLWELLYFIDKLNLNYKFYLHHYSMSVAKTILYCIPNF